MPADGGARAETVRDTVRRYYRSDCEIVAVRRSGLSGASLFVADTMQRARPLRILGTVGRSGIVIEHSAMDLLHPERLVFAYERVMLIGFALAERVDSALLLGLGGGAMCRHLAAYLPATDITAVESDPGVITLAREHFHIRGKVIRGDAEEIVADRPGAFDVVLVDVYTDTGTPPLADSFWRDCCAALRPGGAMAINWAGSPEGRSPKREIEHVAKLLPASFLLTLRGLRPNTIQLVPTAESFRLAGLEARVKAFASGHRLPREDRDVLKRCSISARYPARRRSGKV